MATITMSTVVESVDRGSYKRNLYRYTLSNGEVHERRGWIPLATDNAADMAMRGDLMLTELADAEAARVIANG